MLFYTSRDIDSAPIWDWNVRLSDEPLEELEFGENNLVSLNSSPLISGFSRPETRVRP